MKVIKVYHGKRAELRKGWHEGTFDKLADNQYFAHLCTDLLSRNHNSYNNNYYTDEKLILKYLIRTSEDRIYLTKKHWSNLFNDAWFSNNKPVMVELEESDSLDRFCILDYVSYKNKC